MIVIGEDGNAAPPTLNYCKQYAAQYGIPPEKTYIDSAGNGAGWNTLFTNIYPYLADDGSFALPWDAVLDGDNMEYMYASSYGPYPDINTALGTVINN